jgi:hypothetical protein
LHPAAMDDFPFSLLSPIGLYENLNRYLETLSNW